MVEQMWNGRTLHGRKCLIEMLGLSQKITNIDARLFEELPQLHQKWMIHSASVVL